MCVLTLDTDVFLNLGTDMVIAVRYQLAVYREILSTKWQLLMVITECGPFLSPFKSLFDYTYQYPGLQWMEAV